MIPSVLVGGVFIGHVGDWHASRYEYEYVLEYVLAGTYSKVRVATAVHTTCTEYLVLQVVVL